MAEASAKVMDMVQSELKKNPDISNRELREKAVSIDKGVEKLSARQFNATYPLQVKRSMAPPRKRTAKKRGKAAGTRRGKGRAAASGSRAGSKARAAGDAGSGTASTGKRGGRTTQAGRRAGASGGSDARDQVRKVLVQLARDVAEGDRGALVEVAAGIDRYVDRVIKATS